MTELPSHHYASVAHDQLLCACGHQERVGDDFNAAVVRMNAHIRSTFTDEEWEQSRVVRTWRDPATGALKMPPKGLAS